MHLLSHSLWLTSLLRAFQTRRFPSIEHESRISDYFISFHFHWSYQCIGHEILSIFQVITYLTFAVYIPANRRLWTALYSDLWVYRNPSWVKAQLHSIKTRYHSAHDKKSNCYLRICLVLLFAKLPLVPCNATKEGWLVYLPCTKFKPAFWRQVFFDLCDSC